MALAVLQPFSAEVTAQNKSGGGHLPADCLPGGIQSKLQPGLIREC